jgi:alkylated DNA nucleotide flippase Atl1
MKKRKTWQEKLADSKDLPKVVNIDENLSKRWGEGTCAIPSPVEVNEIMKHVPKGKLITINDIREIIAKRYQATIGCPITTGIFAWISANAAEELAAEGKKKITPYWRTLKSKGELNPKYPGGIEHQMDMLEAEGHKIYQKGSHFYVMNFEKHLFKA